MNIDWGLNRPVDYQGNFDRAFGEVEKVQQRNALAQVDINNPESINALLKNPDTIGYGVQLGGMARQNRNDVQQQQERVGERHLKLATLFSGTSSPEDYAQRLNVARTVFSPDEIDDLPPQFDPQVVGQLTTFAQRMGGGKAEEYTLAPGATRMRGGQVIASSPYRPERITDPTTGQVFEYTGGTPQPSPPQVGHVEDGFRFKGGNPADPSAWEQVQGGAPSQGGATFP